MNHKTIEVKNRLGELPPINHFPTQSLQHNHITRDSERTPTGPCDSDGVQETKIANSLLAATLACYKSAVINTFTPPYPLNLQKDLASYMERQASEAAQSISTGSSDLERQAASIALTSTCIKDALPLIDVIFYITINLKRPLSSFSESIKFNAKAAFNVVIASIADGIRTQDYERLLVLCMYLKDTENCYPLRSLAVASCLDVICVGSIPYFARASILRFILGPADFILYHLETRIQLSGAISILLQQDPCEDIEFRALLLRIAKKIGVAKPKSLLEQRKARFYHYLDHVISDPTRYSQQENIVAYMTVSQWSSVLDRDLVLYIYLTEYKQQLLPFLEALRISGVVFTLFEPTIIQHAILGENDYNDEVMIDLYLAQHRLYLKLDDCAKGMDGAPNMDHAVQVALEYIDPNSSIQLRLEETCNLVCCHVHVSDDQLSKKNVDQVLDIAIQMLQIATVAPSQFMNKILWITAICFRTFSKLRQQGCQMNPKGTAVCLDIFLVGVERNGEKRRHDDLTKNDLASVFSGGQSQSSEEDLMSFLSLFTLLFPANQELTWRCIATENHPALPIAPSEPSICADYLIRLFGQLVPHLERLVKLEKVTSTLILADLLLQILSLQIPSTVLIQDHSGIVNALNNIADLQKDSALSASSVWRDMHDMTNCPHPLPILESRLRALQSGLCQNHGSTANNKP